MLGDRNGGGKWNSDEDWWLVGSGEVGAFNQVD